MSSDYEGPTPSTRQPRSDDERAAAFIATARPHHERLVDAAIHGMADRQCDLAAGDGYNPAHYREDAEAAVGAVLQYLAWTDGFGLADVAALSVRVQTLTEERDDWERECDNWREQGITDRNLMVEARAERDKARAERDAITAFAERLRAKAATFDEYVTVETLLPALDELIALAAVRAAVPKEGE